MAILAKSKNQEAAGAWTIAFASLALISLGWGPPYFIAVALKPIAADLDTSRSVPSLASSLAYIGSGVGGIFMGWLADRIGAMWTALFGSLMIGCGSVMASLGAEWQLYVGYGLMIGLIGNAGIFAPLMANTTRWFTVKRGTALALVASGQQVAGTIWPSTFRAGIDALGWRSTLFWYGIMVLCVLPPICLLLRRRPPIAVVAAAGRGAIAVDRPLGFHPNVLQALLCLAIIGCCVAMAMPMSHVAAFCSDLGYEPARGAEMLSVLLAMAFVSRMIWGRMSDRIGGLRTILIGSACQAFFLSGYMFVDNLYLLFALSAAFGLGFGGIIPSYVLTIREVFPVSQAGWRIGTILLCGLGGMALGAWMGGAVFDHFADYRPAFGAGVIFNIANLLLIGGLVLRQSAVRPIQAVAAA